MTANPVPMVLDDPLDYDEARSALREINRQRQEGRRALEQAHEALAAAERDYRVEKARQWVQCEGTAQERAAAVDSKTAELRYTRDVKRGLLEAAKERLNELDGQRASLHRVVEWSMRLSPVPEQAEVPA